MYGPTRPRIDVDFDERSFSDLKRSLRIRLDTRRAVAVDPLWAAPVPLEVGLQITYRCNLRCAHCYQWNPEGHFRLLTPAQIALDLDLDVIEKVLRETSSVQAKAYLWGGEPLIHREFDHLSRLLERWPRPVNICTNGLLIMRRADDLQRLGANVTLLVSLDGLEPQHDGLRGDGTFRETVEQICGVVDLQRRGAFGGQISVSGMISDDSIGHLYEFVELAESLGVSTAYMQFPWTISPESAQAMDAFCVGSRLAVKAPAEGASWHRYGFGMGPDRIAELREEIARIAARRWRIRVRYLPDVADDELIDFVSGASRPAQARRVCLAIANRLDVFADGSAGTCKFFPELATGDLKTSTVAEVWHGERFRALRAAVRGVGLMPACSRCGLLYANGD